MKRILICIVVSIVYFLLGLGIVYFGAPPQVLFTWDTVSEVDAAGFLLCRSDSPVGPFLPIIETPIPAKGDPLVGASYEYVDRDVVWGQRYYYQLKEVERGGDSNAFPDIVEGKAGAGLLWALAAGALLAVVGAVVSWYSTKPREGPPGNNGDGNT
ncbi:MAG: hypothetical protein AB8I69_09560 [Anaerolineae bacterium]|jgi:hypothetical protein